MPTIQVLENMLGDEVSSDRPDGGRLLDILDEMAAPVQFSCMDAKCAMCRCEVEEGMDLMEPPKTSEAERLLAVRAKGNQRLTCQAVALPGPGTIRLRWAAAD